MDDPNGDAPDGDFEIPTWDPVAILRQRADQAASDRDASVSDLRGSMSDEAILEEFGLDLGEIED